MTTTVKLTQHDARLLSSAIAGYVTLVGSGDIGADFTNSLAESSPREYASLMAVRDMLARSKEGMTDDSITSPTAGTFLANLERLRDLGLSLIGDGGLGVEAEAKVEPVQVVAAIDKGGNETSAKRYALWLTHDELHLVHWAIVLGEAFANRDADKAARAGSTYARLRQDVVDDAMFDRFIDKFNAAHQQARIDDGEVPGMKSDVE